VSSNFPVIEGLTEHQVMTLTRARKYKQYRGMIEAYREGKCLFCDPLGEVIADHGWRDVFQLASREPKHPGLLAILLRRTFWAIEGLATGPEDPAQPGKVGRGPLGAPGRQQVIAVLLQEHEERRRRRLRQQPHPRRGFDLLLPLNSLAFVGGSELELFASTADGVRTPPLPTTLIDGCHEQPPKEGPYMA